MTGPLTLPNGVAVQGVSTGGAVRTLIRTEPGSTASVQVNAANATGSLKLYGAALTFNDLKVWHENNDGAGSTLDTDLWRGKGYVEGSTTVDIGSIPAGGTLTTVLTLSGANLGDFCLASSSTYTSYLSYSCEVTSTIQAIVNIRNYNTVAVDPPTKTYYVRALAR
jgi:hypothetical protein